MKLFLLSVLLALSFSGSEALIPEPYFKNISDRDFASLLPSRLAVISSHPKCATLSGAIQRFGIALNKLKQTPLKMSLQPDPRRIVTSLNVHLTVDCDETARKAMPGQNMVEEYKLATVCDYKACQITIQAGELWGAIRALATLEQLVVQDDRQSLYVPLGEITDMPRFIHRGFLIDSSRHFLSVPVIEQFLDAMAIVKMNVLHWHIVDDQSFPYESYTFPELSQGGAFKLFTQVYSQLDVARVIEYARQRGIRVMPEFDTPGHTESWGHGLKSLLTKCYSGSKPNGQFGPIDPSIDDNYRLLRQIFDEIKTVFPDKYIHLGGDEVAFDCWASNPMINDFMHMANITSFAGLESYYIERLCREVIDPNLVKVFWEEVYFNGAMASTNDVVHVWMNGPKLAEKMANVTRDGFKVIVSAPWYLNYISYGTDWHGYYTYDPQNFPGTDVQKQRVFGGEACMWGEYVDDSNLISYSWPRGASVAERLWSNASVTDFGYFWNRLSQLTCFMKSRGLRDVTPINGPSFCDDY